MSKTEEKGRKRRKANDRNYRCGTWKFSDRDHERSKPHPWDAPLLTDHLARDKDHFYQNDERIEEAQWRERLQAIKEK